METCGLVDAERHDQRTAAAVPERLSVYAIERQDQQTSGNAALAIVGAGLAYVGVATAALGENCQDRCDIDSIVIVSSPLPVIALISFLLLTMGNVLQRARYLRELEEELENDLTLPSSVKIPNGFRRSEAVFNLAEARGPRRIASVAMTLLTYGSVFAIEIGFTLYALDLVGGSLQAWGVVGYGLCIVLQVVAMSVALRPPEAERRPVERNDGKRET